MSRTRKAGFRKCRRGGRKTTKRRRGGKRRSRLSRRGGKLRSRMRRRGGKLRSRMGRRGGKRSRRRNHRGAAICYNKCIKTSECGKGQTCSYMPRVGVTCPDSFNPGLGWCV